MLLAIAELSLSALIAGTALNNGQLPLTAGITQTESPSATGVARPPVSRMLVSPTNTFTC